ncbi:hypothetical protein HanRHA438_Chr06g0269021 [Helianthus annuus]|nr:hypothetical protein HanRHA438_Chr06g0269021 [Helianthus annuus]
MIIQRKLEITKKKKKKKKKNRKNCSAFHSLESTIIFISKMEKENKKKMVVYGFKRMNFGPIS